MDLYVLKHDRFDWQRNVLSLKLIRNLTGFYVVEGTTNMDSIYVHTRTGKFFKIDYMQLVLYLNILSIANQGRFSSVIAGIL